MRIPRWLTSCLLVITVGVLLWYSGIVSVAFVGLGGFASEQVVGTESNNTASLIVSPDANGPPVIGFAPAVTSAGHECGTQVLSGNLTSMNTLAQVGVFFEWTDNAGTHTTPEQPMVATGSFSADISGSNPLGLVRYRAAGTYDGTVYGNPISYSSNAQVGYMLLANILPVAVVLLCTYFSYQTGDVKIFMAGLVGALMAYLVGMQVLSVIC